MAKKNVPLEDCMIHLDEPCTCVNQKRVKGLYSDKVNRPNREVNGDGATAPVDGTDD